MAEFIFDSFRYGVVYKYGVHCTIVREPGSKVYMISQLIVSVSHSMPK